MQLVNWVLDIERDKKEHGKLIDQENSLDLERVQIACMFQGKLHRGVFSP